jgi:hypothetical protein
MVRRCANPRCEGPRDYREPLKLYPLELRSSSSTLFLWLCDACAALMEVEGAVVLPPEAQVFRHAGLA